MRLESHKSMSQLTCHEDQAMNSKRHWWMLCFAVSVSLSGCDRMGFERYISESQFASIRTGMTKPELLSLLGSPEGGATGGIWQYHIKGNGYSDLVTIFVDASQGVSKVRRD